MIKGEDHENTIGCVVEASACTKSQPTNIANGQVHPPIYHSIHFSTIALLGNFLHFASLLSAVFPRKSSHKNSNKRKMAQFQSIKCVFYMLCIYLLIISFCHLGYSRFY